MDPTEHIIPADIEKPVPVMFWDRNDIKSHSRGPLKFHRVTLDK